MEIAATRYVKYPLSHWTPSRGISNALSPFDPSRGISNTYPPIDRHAEVYQMPSLPLTPMPRYIKYGLSRRPPSRGISNTVSHVDRALDFYNVIIEPHNGNLWVSNETFYGCNFSTGSLYYANIGHSGRRCEEVFPFFPEIMEELSCWLFSRLSRCFS